MLRTAVLILLLLPGLWARPQPFPQLRFTRLTERDGLSCDKASGVTQDKDGIIWISTNNGLNRWDGYGFTHWFANPDDSMTIPANLIEDLVADKKDNIWMVTSGGVCKFSTLTHKVTRFGHGDTAPAVFRTFDDPRICFVNDEYTYIVSPDGLYQIHSDGHYSVVDEGFSPFVFSERRYTHYYKMVRDREGGLWAFRENHVYRLDPVTKRVRQSFEVGEHVSIYDMLFDSEDHCWVSTWNRGILRIDADGVVSAVPGDFKGVAVERGVEWSYNGRRYLVFATTQPSLVLVDEKTGNTRSYLYEQKMESIGAPFVDRQNMLWVPTTHGVLYVSSSGKLFDFLPVSMGPGGKPDSAYLATAYDLREEPSGYWIARRYNGGMLWFDKDWRLVHGWLKPVDSVGEGFREDIGTIREVYDFRQRGDSMFITTEWGIMVMDLKTLHRTMIRYQGPTPIIRLRTIVPVSDHKWLIRSFSNGVFEFDPVALRFVRHYQLVGQCTGCGNVSANYMVRDHKGRIFLTTNGGLFQYNERADTFLPVRVAGPHSFGNSLIGEAVDSAGLIWLGVDDGICAYDPDAGRITRVLTEHNSIGPVNRIAIDSLQNVWFSSPAGYWCWLRRQDKLIQFRFSLGLPDNDEGFFYTASNGNVYAGCTGGVIWFHNDRLMQYDATSSVKIMDAVAGGVPVDLTTASNGEKRLTLGPDQNNLQVNFDVINYDLPENNLFYYRLKPGPGSWVQLENGRLSFNNLPAGEYELAVRGGNKVTGNFTAEDRLVFVIRPYWWQSWWFKTLVALALMSSIGVLVWLRIRHIRREAAFRQKMADTELRALRAQMNPHFIFNSLNSIENFMMKNEKWLASDYLNKFARLFRMILHSSRNELVPFAKDMEALQLYVDLESLRFNNKFDYRTKIDPLLVDGEYRVPSLLIQPYVENAIVHGIGLSKKRGLYVQLTAFLQGDCIHYIIRDNGIGRRQAEEVNQVNRPNHRSVGLSITADRINIFSHQQRSEGSVTITDLWEEDGTAAGTKVEVIIKAV
ncbi:MAG TPA: histidine kinase [Puia sp.]|jgi:ligand-binding sensor domain-containing protein|nr:histidine kinase [Puia sp.]